MFYFYESVLLVSKAEDVFGQRNKGGKFFSQPFSVPKSNLGPWHISLQPLGFVFYSLGVITDTSRLIFLMNVLWTHSLWECEQPVFRFVGLSHVLTPLSGCTNKLSAVRRWGQKAGLWARRGGVRWIKERCGKGGISRRSSWDHHQEENCQIYRIQCSPGKQGGFDALTYSASVHTHSLGKKWNNQQYVDAFKLFAIPEKTSWWISHKFTSTTPWRSGWNSRHAAGIWLCKCTNTHIHANKVRLQDSPVMGKWYKTHSHMHMSVPRMLKLLKPIQRTFSGEHLNF